jgi:hypothetical protein
MHMTGKHGAGFELEKDGSAAGLRVEPKKPSMDARPFGSLPAYRIAVDDDLAGHDYPLGIEPSLPIASTVPSPGETKSL